MQLIPRRVRPDDTGAVAVIVALVLVPILLSMGALLVDLGHMYADRRQQQNAADAAALAVAADCANDFIATATCQAAAEYGTAQTFASGNGTNPGSHYAVGESSNVSNVCIAGIVTCPPPGGPNCTAPTSSNQYVQVLTKTGTPSGTSSLLPNVFERFLAGDKGTGQSVSACARAWYSPVGGTVAAVPVTFSDCEWQHDTAGGYAPPASLGPAGVYQGPPGSATAWPPATYERYLTLHSATTQQPAGCTGWQAGADGPGAFGWLDHPKDACKVFISITGSYGDKTGNGTPNICVDPLASLYATPQVIFLPIYSTDTGNGNNLTYTLSGFAAFVLTGYHLPGTGKPAPSWLTGLDCTTVLAATSTKSKAKDISCLSGFFTQKLVPAGAILGGQPRGAVGVHLLG